MATATRTISPIDGGRKVISAIRTLLPADARWFVSYFDEDGIHLLDIYTNEVDRMAVHAAAGPVLSELGRKGLSMAIIMDSLDTLRGRRDLKSFPVK